MKLRKYFIIGDANTQNPNPGDIFAKDGIKHLITLAEYNVPLFYDVNAFTRDESVWNIALKEADYLVIGGRPRLGELEVVTYCDYFFWEDVIAAKNKGIVTVDFWAGSGFREWNVEQILDGCKDNPAVSQVIQYESMLDYVIARDRLTKELIGQRMDKIDIFPCSSYWAGDWHHVEPKTKVVNAIALRFLPGNEWLLEKLVRWQKELYEDKPTFFIAHQIQEYEWFLAHLGPSEYLLCIYDPRSLLEFYSRVDKLISLRVHGSIPALSFGARVFNIATDSRSLALKEFGVDSIFYLDLEERDAISEDDFQPSKLDKKGAEKGFIRAFRDRVMKLYGEKVVEKHRQYLDEFYWKGASKSGYKGLPLGEDLAEELFHYFEGEGFTCGIDLGCSFGAIPDRMRKGGIDFYGVDLSEYAINYGRKTFGLNEIYLGSIHDLGRFEDNKFDFVISVQVFEHLPVELLDSLLHELKRTCKPGAKLWISLVCGYPGQLKKGYGDIDQTHITLFPKEWWDERFNEYGFDADDGFDRKIREKARRLYGDRNRLDRDGLHTICYTKR
ncbi:MAG: methyltransferase domain-containing protein [Firmicutes bacterium]|nr:methyltransferase domain-containing protein [Bacillota bacterium]